MQSHMSPFSISPIREASTNSPSLSTEMALTWVFFGGFGGLGAFALEPGLANFEPFTFTYAKTSGNVFCWLAVTFTAFLLTGCFVSKQWRYYYTKSGRGKEGIFQTLGHVNQIEQTIDIALCFLGGLLLAASTLPTCWFLVLAIYNMVVLVRTVLILLRPRFSACLTQKGEEVPPWYSQIRRFHNGMWVPAVLWGWIATHAISCMIAIVIFTVITIEARNFTNIPFLAIVIVYFIAFLVLIILLWYASDYSYRFGCRVCPPPTNASQ